MKKGFTLIELLIVVLIIGILAAIAVPQYQKSVTKSKIAALFPSLRAFMDAQNRYLLENGSYAMSVDDLDITMPNNGNFTLGPVSGKPQFGTSVGTIAVGVRMDVGHIVCEALANIPSDQQICMSLGGVKETCSPNVYQGTGTIYCYGIK